jgi:hypothetical protein
VSLLLGHSSVKIAEKHYKPWVRSLQRKLEEDVRRAWSVALDLVGRRALSGDATFSGTNYQASAIAYVLVHVLTQSKLRRLSADDTPATVSGEVRGPGDDARIEIGDRDLPGGSSSQARTQTQEMS